MKLRCFFALFISGFLLCNYSYTQTKNQSNKLEIYILLGQSNMAGRGEITEEFVNEGNPNVMMLNKTNEWVLAKHPLHFDKPKAVGVGPGIAFGIKMAEANPKVKIGLVPCAVGGTSISVWAPGKFDKDTQTHPYDDAIIRIHEAMKSGVIKGILWHQGESDTSPERSENYLSNLETLITRIRKECNNPNLPIVVGELGLFKDNRRVINDIISVLPSKDPYTAIAKSDGLEQKGDGAHFNSKSAQILGYRFAEQMLKLQLK